MPDAFVPDTRPNHVLQVLPDPVICTDGKGRIVLFNRAAEQCFGYAASEIIGHHVEVLIPAKYRKQHAEDVDLFSAGRNSAERSMGAQRWVWGLRKNGEEFPAEARVSREIVDGEVILTVVHRDMTERATEELRQEAVAHELDHRIKNVFSVVGALVALSAKSAANVPEFSAALLDRLQGLAATQSFLTGRSDKQLTLAALITAEVGHYCGGDLVKLAISGPEINLKVETVQPLAMAFHELATNSVKYGALGEVGGLVEVTVAGEDGRSLTIEWREHAGREVHRPERRGFGSLLIEQMVRRALHGEIACTYHPQGLACRMTLPTAGLVAAV